MMRCDQVKVRISEQKNAPEAYCQKMEANDAQDLKQLSASEVNRGRTTNFAINELVLVWEIVKNLVGCSIWFNHPFGKY